MIMDVIGALEPFAAPILAGIGAVLAGLGTQALVTGGQMALAWVIAHWPLVVLAGLIAAMIYAWNNLGEAGKILAGVLGVVAAAVGVLAAKQWLLNLAMTANPIGAIIMAAAALIGIIVAVILWLGNLWKYNADFKIGVLKAWNAIVYGVSYALGVLAATVMDILGFMWNHFADFADFLANLFFDPINTIARLFFDLFDGILGVVQGAAGILGKIFGQDWGGAISNFRTSLDKFTESAIGEKKIELGIARYNYANPLDVGAAAANAGVGLFGAEINEDQIRADAQAAQAIRDAKREEKWNLDAGAAGYDYDDLITNSAGGKALKTANQNEIIIREEDLKLLHDIATRDYQLTYQQLTPQLNVNIDTVRETADANQIIEILAAGVAEMVDTRLVIPA
jgi:hypothetical protein